MDVHDFENEPPFPEGLKLAALEKISLAKLLDVNDAEEAQRLVEACKHYGFFYIRLDDCAEGVEIMDVVKKLFKLSDEVFAEPLEEKNKYDLSEKGSFFGYKAVGATIIDREGTKDKMEAWNLGKDDMMQTGTQWPNPPLITDNRPLIQDYIARSHGIAMTILRALERQIHLPEGAMTELHDLAAESGDHVRFLKVPPQPDEGRQTAVGEHTDFGSITVLFNRLSGLRVVEPGANNPWNEWPWVRPLPGHAIINLGDAMVKFSNGLFRSNVHRVDPPVGLQKEVQRYSLVYFSRPRDDVLLKRIEGSDEIPPLAPGEVEEEITSKDWVARRAMGKRVFNFKGTHHWDQMQGTEQHSKLKPLLLTPRMEVAI
ncbi:hypothetical protein B7494_g6169 [Chlorociboria aeruginascens]|nr:hypothetical protein B7494_g6169 [Chlorociboria aeruginascens]